MTVTKNDIEQGQRRDPEQCAIARALVRAGLEHFGVMGPSVMVADQWGRLTSLWIPEAVGDWIFNFDAGNEVSPISFELELPDAEPGPCVTQRETRRPARRKTRKSRVEKLDLELTPMSPPRRSRCQRFGTMKPPRLGKRMESRLGLTLKLG